MKKTIISAVLLVVASILVAIGVAEISFPESFLTFTDQDWLIDIWPKAYRYNIHVGLAAIIIATGICVPAYRLQKDFAIRALETLFRMGIGGMFIFASIYKIQDPHQFAVLVAELCSDIVSSCSEKFFVEYSCVSPAEKSRIAKVVQAEIPALFQESGNGVSVRELSSENLTTEFLENLKSLVNRLKADRDYYALLGLLQILDQAMASLLNLAIAEFEQEKFSIVLNTNRESVGVGLLPRCSCIWERKHRLIHRYNNLESFLYNILLIENSVLGELIDKHYFLKKDLFPHFKERHAVKIAATPLRRERNFKVQLTDKDKIQYFNIAYENPSFEADNELIWKKIWTAAENESDIVVFPELLGNAEMTEFMSSKIKSLSPADAEHAQAV